MNALLTKAVEAVSKLPQDEQDAIARELLARIEADARWDEAFADPRSPGLLKRLSDEALAEIARGDVLDYDQATKSR